MQLKLGQALLVVTRGPNEGEALSLQSDVTTVGRHPESDVFLYDRTVSRRHAEIHRQEGRFFIRDVGSLNGTYLNSRRVEGADLASGDELQIGRYKLRFFSG